MQSSQDGSVSLQSILQDSSGRESEQTSYNHSQRRLIQSLTSDFRIHVTNLEVNLSQIFNWIPFNRYAGEVNVSQEQLPSFLKTADRLKVKGLAETQSPFNKS